MSQRNVPPVPPTPQTNADAPGTPSSSGQRSAPPPPLGQNTRPTPPAPAPNHPHPPVRIPPTPTPTASFQPAELIEEDDAPTVMGRSPMASVEPPPPMRTSRPPPSITAQQPMPQPPPQAPATLPRPIHTQPIPTNPLPIPSPLANLAPSSHSPHPAANPSPHAMAIVPAMQPAGIRTDAPRDLRAAGFHVVRSRAYSFVVDPRGMPVEVGSGRFAKAYLGEERWLESKTDFRRDVVIKILQRGVSDDDHMRFQMEKELLERVQGHPNIVQLHASGEAEDPELVPAPIRHQVESEFMILERMEMSLEERLKGSRFKGKKEDLLGVEMRERIFRVLDYMIPITSAVEYAHLVRNVCHRDIKPANVLLRLPDPSLRGSALEVRLADFNVAKLHDEEMSFGLTSLRSVPGTLFFQSPEQETNTIELLVNVTQGSPEVEYFEDFYIHIAKNDAFSLFNRGDNYPILYADRAKKRIVLGRPYRDGSETNVRARVQKSVGRPADIYSLGALFYYLVTGAYGNPKTLYDAFHKFIEYEKIDENNSIEAYLDHEYSVIRSLSAPRPSESGQPGDMQVAPADRFFTYKHYLDGNGDLIDPYVMKIIARCMIRSKPDSYCQAHEIETRGISSLMSDLIDLYSVYGIAPAARPANLARRGQGAGGLLKPFSRTKLRLWWLSFARMFKKQ